MQENYRYCEITLSKDIYVAFSKKVLCHSTKSFRWIKDVVLTHQIHSMMIKGLSFLSQIVLKESLDSQIIHYVLKLFKR